MAVGKKEIKIITVPVEGMTCAACVGHVESAIRNVPGVEDVTVNLGTEKASVRLGEDDLPAEAIREAVVAAGYSIGTQSASLN